MSADESKPRIAAGTVITCEAGHDFATAKIDIRTFAEADPKNFDVLVGAKCPCGATSARVMSEVIEDHGLLQRVRRGFELYVKGRGAERFFSEEIMMPPPEPVDYVRKVPEVVDDFIRYAETT